MGFRVPKVKRAGDLCGVSYDPQSLLAKQFQPFAPAGAYVHNRPVFLACFRFT